MNCRQLSDCQDLFERRLVSEVEAQGFSVVHEPEFCYTVGLWSSAFHPELVIFGLPAAHGQQLLKQAVSHFPLDPGEPLVGLAEGYALQVSPVDSGHHHRYFAYARWFYRGDRFRALQLIWPDPENRYPGHPDYSEHYRRLQPQLSGLPTAK